MFCSSLSDVLCSGLLNVVWIGCCIVTTGDWSTESSENSVSSVVVMLVGIIVGCFVGRVGNSSIVKSIESRGVSLDDWVDGVVDSMSKLFSVSFGWGICETGVSWMVVGGGISSVGVSSIMVGERFVCSSGVTSCCSSSVSICSGSADGFFCLVGWPVYIILVHRPKIWTALGKCSFIFVHRYTLVPV